MYVYLPTNKLVSIIVYIHTHVLYVRIVVSLCFTILKSGTYCNSTSVVINVQ